LKIKIIKVLCYQKNVCNIFSIYLLKPFFVEQGSATAAGSWFALGQSAGAAGLATGTQAGIFGSISSATRYAAELFSECEEE
jgi:hypothetical protein